MGKPQPARVGDRVQILGAHPWSGYAGVVENLDTRTGDDAITVLLDGGLRATVSSTQYYRITGKEGAGDA